MQEGSRRRYISSQFIGRRELSFCRLHSRCSHRWCWRLWCTRALARLHLMSSLFVIIRAVKDLEWVAHTMSMTWGGGGSMAEGTRATAGLTGQRTGSLTSATQSTPAAPGRTGGTDMVNCLECAALAPPQLCPDVSLRGMMCLCE